MPGRYPSRMPADEGAKDAAGRKFFAGTRLIREVSYLHPDEANALAKRSEKERCSKAEIIRRALRDYLGIT